MFNTAFWIFLVSFALVGGRSGITALIVAVLVTFLAGLIGRYVLKMDIYKRG